MVAAHEQPARVGRDIGDDVCRRSFQALDDELSGQVGRAAEPVLLPGGNEIARGTRVGDRRPGAAKA
jgi:hypothetical protein